jgi:hypothetical protein
VDSIHQQQRVHFKSNANSICQQKMDHYQHNAESTMKALLIPFSSRKDSLKVKLFPLQAEKGLL